MSNETTLDDVLALVAKATPGEWRIFIPDDYAGGDGFPGLGLEAESGTAVVWYADSPEQGIENDPDAEAIAAAVNYLRAHGDELRAALEDARRYRALVDSGAYAPGMRAPCPWALHGSGPLSTKDELDAAIDAAQEVEG